MAAAFRAAVGKIYILWKQQLQRHKEPQPPETDFLPLQGTDYVEFYVGNAKQAAHFYKTAFGFPKPRLRRSRNRNER